MWHASIAAHRVAIPTTELRRVAYQQLHRVGDAHLGQWEQATDRAFHLRRRLSDRDLAKLPEEHRELVDVRSWPEQQLLDLISTAISSERHPQRRAALARLALTEAAT